MRKKLIYDSILNIIATSLPLIILQLIILPITGNIIGDANYGLMVTLVSLSTLLSHPLGNVLNNVRLLVNEDYQKNRHIGDFNILLVNSIIINSILVIVGTIYYEGQTSFINIVLIWGISCLNLVREYLIVSFRLSLNYKGILVNNIILGIGYLVGMLLFYIYEYWQFIYIVGALFSLLYIIMRSNLLKEGFTTTILFKNTSYKAVILFLSTFMNTVLSYADKLILFPLLGPAAVSVYYTATVLSKLITRVITPVTSVMLSYLVKMQEFKIKHFSLLIGLMTGIGLVGYYIIVVISEPMLYFLYPQWASESMQLIYITAATTVVGLISSVINPIILRFKNITWQLGISGVNLIITIISVFIFYYLYGLLGFCIGMLISSILKLIMMIFIFFLNNGEIKKESLNV
ncbi:hypothetical protein U9M49_10960 [Cytobacillus sp. OWB-43]|uniref:hypothetical protein n=1 Tax=Cytobacillus sp. OWB-43 TaxID=3108468 RepID=UPI002AFF05C2|nr:hypothetical protein [Cytobacillus sp. OWB-43]MEA1853615.1 hypothetical protein [Cytobacillus sp. OWB-43]